MSSKEEVMRLFESGVKKAEIARQLNVTRAFVSKNTPITKKYDEADLKRVQTLRIQGMYQKEISKQTGIGLSTVQRMLLGFDKSFIVKKPKKVVKKVEPEKEVIRINSAEQHYPVIRELYLSGMNYTRIARQLKVGFSTVKNAVVAMGIEDESRDSYSGVVFRRTNRHVGKPLIHIKGSLSIHKENDAECEIEFRERKLKQYSL